MNYKDFKEKYGLLLDEQQDAAVQATDGNVLLLAVPGSGKTTVLVSRLGYLTLCCGATPESILTMTYTKAATIDMKKRCEKLFGTKLSDMLEFKTINSVAAGIIRSYNPKAFDLISDDMSARVIGEIYREQTKNFPTESDIKDLQSAITYIKNMSLSDSEIEKLGNDDINMLSVFEEYNRRLIAKHLMDYDDQLVYALTILKKYSNIRSRYTEKYKYICVDEAQDTSKIQHEIIKILAGDNNNLFMVGDEDQSIYGFRAAYPQALANFEKEHTNAKVLLLEHNYRSTAKIVAAADRFIADNKNRHEKHMVSNRPQGADIEELKVYDRGDQYTHLIKVAEACSKKTAVLYRNNDSALPLIDLLERNGIPYVSREMKSTFFTNRVIRDVKNIICFARNPADGDTFKETYYKLGAGINKVTAEKAAKRSKVSNSPILIDIAGYPGISDFTKVRCYLLQNLLSKLLRVPANEAIRIIRQDMGYDDYALNHGFDLGKLDILELLGSREPTAQRLLCRLDELSKIVSQRTENAVGHFILSTIHGSKGLEYEKVYLIDVVDGILPGAEIPDSNCKDEEVILKYEEERRLFYVAMTRAINELKIFTFLDPTLKASFSDSVFEKHKYKSGNGVEVTQKQRLQRKEKVVPLNISQIAKDFFQGTKVVHTQYGKGVIVKKDDDIITIKFEDGVEKRFSVVMLIEKDYISIQM